jgi:hypothetical protein
VKADLRRGSGGGPEEPLRPILRRWEAPPAPAALEEDLRRTFRRRKPKRGGMVWLALAAALALLAMWPLTRRESATLPARSVARVPEARPRPAIVARPPAEPEPVVPAATTANPNRRASRAKSGVVIVEPRQAELLARLHEDLQRPRPTTAVFSGAPVTVASNVPVAIVPDDAAGTPTLAAGVAAVPAYQGNWERVEGAWPPVQRSSPVMGR